LFATIAGEVAFTNLTPASGRQDHTTSPSAKAHPQKPPGGFAIFPAEAPAKAGQRARLARRRVHRIPFQRP